MPSPFIRFAAGPMNRSKTPADEMPHGAVEPVPERVAGPVFAYRGQETHGVEPTAKQVGRPDEWADERASITYEPAPDPGPDPIPVKIVQDKSREVTRGRISRAEAPLTGYVQILGSDYQERRRITTKIKNIDTAVVYVATDQNAANSITGWPLNQNEVLEVKAQDAIYAAGSGSATAPQAIMVYVEYTTPYTEVEGWSYGK